MEDRTIIRERHGVANARRISAASVENSETQGVLVTDGREDEVQLHMSANSYPAGLTPDQARYIATELVASASRIEARNK